MPPRATGQFDPKEHRSAPLRRPHVSLSVPECPYMCGLMLRFTPRLSSPSTIVQLPSVYMPIVRIT